MAAKRMPCCVNIAKLSVREHQLRSILLVARPWHGTDKQSRSHSTAAPSALDRLRLALTAHWQPGDCRKKLNGASRQFFGTWNAKQQAFALCARIVRASPPNRSRSSDSEASRESPERAERQRLRCAFFGEAWKFSTHKYTKHIGFTSREGSNQRRHHGPMPSRRSTSAPRVGSACSTVTGNNPGQATATVQATASRRY